MDKIKYVLLSIGFLGILLSCRPTTHTATQKAERPDNGHYVSIDGLWRVTPETAIQFPHGTLEPVIQVSGDAFGKLTARGCYLWNQQFYDYWELDSVHFIDSTNQLVIHDNDGGIYKGVVDPKKKLIRGLVCWDDKDTSDTDQLDFVRDETLDVNRLFIPYPPGPDGRIKYTYQVPEAGTDQWATASIFEFVKDTTAFYHLMERIIKQQFGRLESFLVVKDQKLVLEEYFYGYDRSQLHRINSCTKSVTSLLLGITLERHKNIGINQPVFHFFPQCDSLKTPEKEKITLKQVLTMTSGLTDDDDFEAHGTDDFVKQLFSQPLASTPGEKFKYNNNGTNLLGMIIQGLEGKQVDEFAKEVMFNKLGISEFDWKKENGVLQCHNGLRMYPRDMAKIGLLVVNNGSWNGEQIVPKEWIDSSTKPQVAESEFFNYGYQWWCRSKQNKPWWNHPAHGGKTEHDMALALGYGGQFIMAIRDLNMVVVATSSDNNESNGKWLAKIPMVVEEVVPLFE